MIQFDLGEQEEVYRKIHENIKKHEGFEDLTWESFCAIVFVMISPRKIEPNLLALSLREMGVGQVDVELLEEAIN